jgi:hypothetical protein
MNNNLLIAGFFSCDLNTLGCVIGYVLCGLVGLLGLAVLWRIYDGTIDLSRLISEPTGDASMSRFQFLVFTFVISLSLFLVIVAGNKDSNGKPAFPASIPGGILTLLGISGSSYAVGKAIQFSDPAGVQEQPLTVKISPASPTVKIGNTLQFTATLSRDVDAAKLNWEVIAGSGQVDTNGLFSTSPAAAPGPPAPPASAPPMAGQHATVKVTLLGYDDVSDLAVVTFVS